LRFISSVATSQLIGIDKGSISSDALISFNASSTSAVGWRAKVGRDLVP
jgi:hypothetical protein